MSDPNEEKLNDVRALVSEHFINYAVVVMLEDGSLCYRFSNSRTAKHLFSDAAKDLEEWDSDIEFDAWVDEEVEEDREE